MLSGVKKVFILNNSGADSEETENTLARIYCLLGAILTPVYALTTFNTQTVLDFTCLSIITIFFLFCFAFSSRFFAIKPIRENLANISLGIYLFISAYAIYATYERNFAVDYSFGLTILFFIFAIVLKSVRHIIIFFSVTAIIGSIALFFAESPQISVPFLSSFFLIFFCVGFFAMRYKAGIQERLEQREKFLKTLFNNTYDAILLVDFYSREVVDCNDAAIKLFEVFDKNEIIGHKRDNFEENKMSEEQLIQCRRELARDGIWKNETSFITKKGKRFWGEIIITPLQIGNTEYYVAHINDITPQKIAKEALRENEERYRTVFKLNPQPIWIYDRKTLQFIDVNDEAVRHYGHSHSEFLSMTVLDVRSEEEKKRFLNHFKNAENDNQGNRYAGDWKHRKKDGTEIDVEIVRTKINLNGREANLALIKDVTEIRKSESALRQSEERLNNFMNSANDVFALYDENLNLMEVNNAGLMLINEPDKNNIIGKNIAEIFPNIKNTGRLEKYKEVIRTGKSIRIEDFQADYSVRELYFVVVAFKVGNGLGIIARDVSERRKIQQQIIESENNYRQLVELSPDGILIMKENKILFSNRTALGIFGVQKQEEIKNALDFILPEYHRISQERWKKAVNGENVPFAEIKIKRPDGTILELESKPSAITYMREPAMQVVLHDISQARQLEREKTRAEIAEETATQLQKEIEERLKTEKKLLDAQKYTRKLIDSSLDMICASDTEGKIFEFNEAAQKTFGYSRNEIIGRHVSSLYANREEHNSINKLLLEGNGTHSGEIINMRKNRERFIAYLSCSVLKDDEGRVFGFMGVSRDITEYKKAENELRESHRFVDSVIENIPNMIFVKDAQDLRFVRINKAGEELLGLSKEELLGKNDYDFFPEEQADFFTSKDRKTLSEKKLEDIPEEPIDTKRWGRRILHTKKIPILDDAGNPKYLLGISEDITEMKVTEELIIKSLREKEVLLKEVHHRVKNNMQVISSILNLQSAYIKDKSTLKILRESQDRIKTMALIHENLYQANDFSKIDFSEYVINLSRNLVHSYRVSHNSTELKLNIGENILLDIDQAIPCGLIINELVSNAFKHAFSNRKEGIVNVKLSREKGKICLEITDNGKGMSEQIDFKNTETLGLQLVTTLADQLDGTITLEKEGGTKFTVSFMEKLKNL